MSFRTEANFYLVHYIINLTNSPDDISQCNFVFLNCKFTQVTEIHQRYCLCSYHSTASLKPCVCTSGRTEQHPPGPGRKVSKFDWSHLESLYLMDDEFGERAAGAEFSGLDIHHYSVCVYVSFCHGETIRIRYTRAAPLKHVYECIGLG
jgi:hypothetical protein